MHFIIKGKYGPLLGATLGLIGGTYGTFQVIKAGNPPLAFAISIAAFTLAGLVLGVLFWIFDTFSGTTTCKNCGGRIWPTQLLCMKCYKSK